MAFNGTGSNVTSLNAANISSGTLAVGRGGTGATTLNAAAVIIGNGTSAPTFVAPGTSGNILTSNGTAWTSATPAGGGVTSLNGQTGAITNTNADSIGSYMSVLYAINGPSTNPGAVVVLSANSTTAGSNLRYNYSGAQYIASEYSNDGGPGYIYNGGGTALSGTWRAMSAAFLNRFANDPCTGYKRTIWYPGLFVRIS
jgi:hypothetical protein